MQRDHRSHGLDIPLSCSGVGRCRLLIPLQVNNGTVINVWSFPPHFGVAVWLGAGLQPGIGNVVADGLFATAQAIARGAGFIVPG